ncbi:TetR/AcrR family transcriptional regulator [Streptomyces sp. LX-29]|uniref:TetR/AcrR family transcriptional regulator n=1 Tax=Streptomyces sp. LX-29 TaxID=2900152 RepID=UPI00240CED59|nr:TetR/AcrR family transcriptional regulator [Streptomyces sp. LX-29]WFB07251.1 TetR/AcrR family transcriptional regulator [Streptomyces sp. LX-29]
MRADAQRNREQILRAAREIFVDQGPDAPLDEIARRAGVGIATLYRRFPERDDLIQAVALDVFTALIAAARGALAEEPDPAVGLRRFMHAALDLKVGSVMPSLMGRVDVDSMVDAARGDAVEPVQEMLTRAQRDGLIREDVVFGDIALVLTRLSRPLPGARIPFDGDLAHRHLDVYIDGLRAPGAEWSRDPLPGPAVTDEEFKRLRERLAKGPGPAADPDPDPTAGPAAGPTHA